MKTFIITWFNHEKITVKGENILDGLIKAGYNKYDLHDIKTYKEVKYDEGSR